MTIFNSLYTLIKALTPSEKRYFKMYSDTHQKKEKHYVKLFDAIEKLNAPNEQKVIRQFDGELILNNFSMAKKYLFDQIIYSLKEFSSYKDYESELNDMLETYKILRQKGMYEEAAELLQKCKAFAYEKELYMRLYFIITEEIIVILFSKITVSYNPTIPLATERKKILAIITNYSQAGDILYNQKLFLRNKNYARTQDERIVLKENIQPMLDWDEKDINSRIALGMYNQAMSDYYNALGDADLAMHYIKKDLVKKLNEYDPRKAEKTFFVEMGHYLQLCLRHKQFSDFEDYLNEYKKLYTKKMSPVELLIFESAMHYELMYYVLTKQHQKAIDFFNSNKLFQKQKKKISKKALINTYYALLRAHYELKDYKQALKYINMIIEVADEKVEELIFAKIISIIIYYERENREALEYAYRSTYRLMLKTKRKYEVENLIFKYIRNSSKFNNKKEVKAALILLQADIEKSVAQFPIERSIEYYFDFTDWIKKQTVLL